MAEKKGLPITYKFLRVTVHICSVPVGTTSLVDSIKQLWKKCSDSDDRFLLWDRDYFKAFLIRRGTAIVRGNTHGAITYGGDFRVTYFASGEFTGHGKLIPDRFLCRVYCKYRPVSCPLYTPRWGAPPGVRADHTIYRTNRRSGT